MHSVHSDAYQHDSCAQVHAFAADLLAAGGAAAAKCLAEPALAAIQLELYGGAPAADAPHANPGKPSKKRRKARAGGDLPDAAAAAAAVNTSGRDGAAVGGDLEWAGGRAAARDAAVQAAALRLLEALLQVHPHHGQS